jgi:Winged helix DNA-binding domain
MGTGGELPLRSVPVDALVLRYLGAFGPASVADIQLWSGLTRLGEVVERLPMRTFRGEAGQALYDLPDAPRPSADMPAPAALPARIRQPAAVTEGPHPSDPRHRSMPLPPGYGATAGTFLVDGMWQGTWQICDQILRNLPFTKLRRADREALLTEAAQVGAFVAPQVKYDIVYNKP